MKKKRGASFSRAPATDAREREVGDRRPDGDPAGIRSVLWGEGRTLSALKNFCSSHAVHLVSLGFLSPAGRWREKKFASEKRYVREICRRAAPRPWRAAPPASANSRVGRRESIVVGV